MSGSDLMTLGALKEVVERLSSGFLFILASATHLEIAADYGSFCGDLRLVHGPGT